MSDSLRPHELQNTRLPCTSLSPRVCSHSCPLSKWSIQLSHPLQPRSLALIFASITMFCSELALHIMWPKYWSFSFRISPSNEYSGLISGLTDLISLLSKGLSRVFQHHSSKASIFWCSVFLMVQLHIHIWLLEKPQLWRYSCLMAKWCLCFLIHCLGLS